MLDRGAESLLMSREASTEAGLYTLEILHHFKLNKLNGELYVGVGIGIGIGVGVSVFAAMLHEYNLVRHRDGPRMVISIKSQGFFWTASCSATV